VEIKPRRVISRLAVADLVAHAGQAAIVFVALRRRGIDRDYKAGEAGVGVFADAAGLEQAAIADQHHLHALAGGVSDDVGKIWMQRRLATGQNQIANALAEQDVDGVECALAIDIFPALFRQGVAREIAEAAIGVAGIVERELTASRSARGRDQAQRVPQARRRVRSRWLNHWLTRQSSLPKPMLARLVCGSAGQKAT
jgi:hypothetical protein